MSKLRVAIAGATGYAGEELLSILQHHPFVELTTLAASAKREKPIPLDEVFPRFAGRVKLSIESLDPHRLAHSCDVAILALPHGVSMDITPVLLAAGCRVIDLAGDFRLKDPSVFAQWYGIPHSHPELLNQAVYGLTEWFREALTHARLVANPGCYATSVILACAPLLQASLVDGEGIVVDAKSGLTGAGRKAEAAIMFAEMNENLWPYKVNHHPHQPEILQALLPFAGNRRVSCCMVPHVVPLNRGILSTIYLRLHQPCTWDEVAACYHDYYHHAPFVRVRPQGNWPQVRDVAGTNYCDLGFSVDADHRLLIVCAVIDNLMKGAAGQAVQNLNLMAGYPETTGLL